MAEWARVARASAASCFWAACRTRLAAAWASSCALSYCSESAASLLPSEWIWLARACACACLLAMASAAAVGTKVPTRSAATPAEAPRCHACRRKFHVHGFTTRGDAKGGEDHPSSMRPIGAVPSPGRSDVSPGQGLVDG